MLAVDTNIIVRFITRDDPVAARKARDLIDSEDIFVATTVLLEAEWVLRRLYSFDRQAVLEALTSFVGMPRVILEAPAKVAAAMQWAMEGMDFADALHLAASEGCEGFVSFDRALKRKAAQIGALRVVGP